MPVLALGGDKSIGAAEADTLRFVAANVTSGIIPASGHWIMDENPKATIALIVNFLSTYRARHESSFR
jgi:pimeloyl-ACP methyl ester carboxylesterase